MNADLVKGFAESGLAGLVIAALFTAVYLLLKQNREQQEAHALQINQLNAANITQINTMVANFALERQKWVEMHQETAEVLRVLTGAIEKRGGRVDFHHNKSDREET
jgi:hypothetical protein